MAVVQTPAGVYFGTRRGKLFGPADEGESWKELADALPPVVSMQAVGPRCRCSRRNARRPRPRDDRTRGLRKPMNIVGRGREHPRCRLSLRRGRWTRRPCAWARSLTPRRR